ncbi:phage tail protein [Desulfovibrio psychrotolerans]|uniref:Tail protein n=1 Tax=Desulfovibrio psychrotolerans TaxID=415242 RepID=A0A7J0BVJ6_9BACT|nr:phage tail protein [Desulfovibrio psychrotolerans]GFM37739.1 hypothetical protein DSM19430T_24230 [Desulfovibrio psychrotolerans]
MRKLQALTMFLIQATGLPRSVFNAYVDSGDLIPTGKEMGNGFEVARFRYEASIDVYQYPGDGHHLLALVMAWLVERDTDREQQGLPDPKLVVAMLDADSADVEIAVSFEEPIELVADPAGRIPYAGKMWSVTDVPVDVADAVHGMDGQAVDGGHNG